MKYTSLYNRIADTYFSGGHHDSKRQSTDKKRLILFISIVVASLVISLVIFFSLGAFSNKSTSIQAQKKSLSILGNILPLKLDYEFANTSEKVKEITLDLPQLNLADYDILEFALRGDARYGFSSIIKVELESKRLERKSFYIRPIESRWKTFKIPLGKINTLKSFSQLKGLKFIVEGWNADAQQGLIYIDKIKFSKYADD